MIVFYITLILAGLVFFLLLLAVLYKRIYLNKLNYVMHVDVEKEVELPPLGNNMEFDTEQIQDQDMQLIIITE